MNFVGFEESAKNGTAPVLFNRVFIAPNIPLTAGRHIHAVAGFIPGQQPYIKRNREIWNKSGIGRTLRMQGYRTV